MSDRIGVLGELTDATVGTKTPYQVPAGKAARGRLFYRGTSGINSTLLVAMNGIELFRTGALTTGHVHYSSVNKPYNTQTTDAGVDGTTEDKVACAWSREFFLTAGDLLQYTIGTANFGSFNMQFVGVEVDV